MNELATLTVINTATDADLPANALNYSLLAAPSFAEVDPSGVITWTPGEDQGSTTNVFTMWVTDNSPAAVNAQQLSATNTFTVIVNELNLSPALPVQTNRAINELTTLTITNTATDSDIPVNGLSYALLVAPGTATINTNGVITWIPSEADGPSLVTFTTVVTDTNEFALINQQLSATNTFTVTVNEVNVAPVRRRRTTGR